MPKENGAAVAAEAPVAAPRKFRVVHGAVAGVKRNKKGEMAEFDYYHDQIVGEEYLDDNAPLYVSLGAIVPIDSAEVEANADQAPVQE